MFDRTGKLTGGFNDGNEIGVVAIGVFIVGGTSLVTGWMKDGDKTGAAVSGGATNGVTVIFGNVGFTVGRLTGTPFGAFVEPFSG